MTLNVVAFASGSGTNFQALLDHQPAEVAWRIVGLVSNRPDAQALERARAAGVDTVVIPTKDREAGEVAAETLEWLETRAADVLCLAGYMRLVPPEVVVRFRRRILNVHPALLPAFGGKGMYGLRVHAAVLAAGARVSGATVHYVDEEYDQGTIIGQWPVPVRTEDTAETLAARVLAVEHRLYPRAVDHVCLALSKGRDPGPMAWEGERFEVR